MISSETPARFSRDSTLIHFEDETIYAAVFGKNELSELEGAEEEVEARRREREFLADTFRMPAKRIFFMKQIHGADCVKIVAEDAKRNQDVYFAEADSLFTEEPEILLCARTADCLPVFFYRNRAQSSLVGIIHAGWRGLNAGVIEQAFCAACAASALEVEDAACAVGQDNAARTEAEPFRFFMGSCIGSESYTVRSDTAKYFEHKQRIGPDSFLLDLRANAISHMHGLLVERNEIADERFRGCTFRNNDRYYSHRKGDTGRNLNVIMIKRRT